MREAGLATKQLAVLVDTENDRRNFQQRVGLRVEAAGLDVDHDWQEAAKAVADLELAVCGRGHAGFAAGCHLHPWRGTVAQRPTLEERRGGKDDVRDR